MSYLDDILGKKKDKSDPKGKKVDIEITCEVCYWPCDDVVYDKETKMLTAVCPEGHIMRSQIGLDFLLDGK